MPDVRFGIDASGAQRGYAELSRIFAGITQGAQQAADAIKAVQASGAGANHGAQRVQVLQQEVAAQEKVVVATRKRVDATAALAKEQQKQLNVALTALSTLGGEDRAYAQLTQWHIRRTKAMGEEVQVGKLLNEARTRLAASDAKAAEVFSASAVKARDLRVNMAGLNQSMSVIAGAVSKINPQLGSMIQLMSRAGRAAGNLSGGFVSLGVLAGTIGVVAAAFYGLARAADTTNRIPRLFEAIVGGLRTLIAESALGKMAIDVVTTALDKFLNLLPVAPLKVEDLNKELATLRTRYDETAAAQAELDAATTTINNLLDAHLITVEQANKLYDQARIKTIGRAGALEAEAKAVRESAQAQTEYNNALAQFRAEEEAAKATSQRLEDLQFENELLEKQIDALHRGADAVRALAVEEAGLRAVREAKQRDPEISGPQEAAVRAAAQRNTVLKQQIQDQQTEAKETTKIWDNTVKNIQEAFGNLFTDAIVNGKAAFEDFGDFLRNLFGRLAGELAQMLVIKPAIQGVSGILGGLDGTPAPGVGGAGGVMGPLSQISTLTKSISSGFSDAFAKLGLGIGGMIGSANAVQIGKVFGAIGGAIGPGLAGGAVGATIASAFGLKPLKGAAGIGASAGLGLAGAGIGAFFGGPIGAAIGGLLGTLLGGSLGSIFQKTPSQRIGIATAATLAGLPPLEGGLAITRRTPFGFIGAAGGETASSRRGDIQGILAAIANIDKTLSAAMTRAEREMIKQAGLPLIGANAKNTIEKLTVQRVTDVLRLLKVPEATVGQVSGDLAKAKEILDARKAIVDFIEELRGTADAVTESEKALERIEEIFDEISQAAPELGLAIEDLPELRTEAIRRVIKGFNDTVLEGILSITDPAQLAMDNLLKAQETRLKEATALGADLVEVERLTGLERIELLKQINRPIQDLIDTLSFAPAGQSPMAALEAAQARFTELTQPGALGRREDIAAAAQTILSLGEQFLGGPGFAAQRETILDTLSDILAVFPTTASDTGEQITNLSLETARGNAANEQLLMQLVDEVAGLRADNLRLQASIEQMLAA